MPIPNTLYCGDNLEWLHALPDESVDLCYMDPPFFSNRNYEVVWGNTYETRAFGDRFAGGIQHYTLWMRERVALIYQKLKPTASLYLHCDYHASHYLKVMCDELFGRERFLNEIVWAYTRMAAKGQRQLSRAHDVILWYSKGKRWTFHVDAVRQPYSEGSKKREGHTLNRLGSGYSKEGITVLNPKGKFPEDWFLSDIPYLRGKEIIGYKTQKPEILVRRLLEMGARSGGLVLDCFAGGGTTAKVCADLGLSFVCGDVSPVAVCVMARRLNIHHPNVKYEVVGLPHTESALRAMNGHAFAELVCRCKGWDLSEKKSGDKGIDGWANHKKIPIQIKNQRAPVGRPALQQFAGAMKAYKLGFFVSWEFSKEAMEYIAEIKRDEGKEIKTVRCKADIFEELLISQDKAAKLKRYYKARTEGQRDMYLDKGIEV